MDLLNRFIENILRRWMQRTTHQQFFLGYIAVLIFVIFAFPWFRLQSLDAISATNVRFLGTGMPWLYLIVIVLLIKLILMNITLHRKKTIYRLVGWNNNEHMDNVVLLMFLLIILLTLTELVGYYSQTISTVLTPTSTILFIELLLFAGICRQLIVTRVQWKKQYNKPKTSGATKVPQETDSSQKEHIFSNTSKEDKHTLEGFFGKNE